MPSVSMDEAAERLAVGVEAARPGDLGEIYAELFPEKPAPVPPAADIARHVRSGLAAEELVDLWNVLFPRDRDVRYDDETKTIHYNDGALVYDD